MDEVGVNVGTLKVELNWGGDKGKIELMAKWCKRFAGVMKYIGRWVVVEWPLIVIMDIIDWWCDCCCFELNVYVE